MEFALNESIFCKVEGWMMVDQVHQPRFKKVQLEAGVTKVACRVVYKLGVGHKVQDKW